MSDVADIMGVSLGSGSGSGMGMSASSVPLPSVHSMKRKASETPEAAAAKKKARTGGLSREVRFLTETSGHSPILAEPKKLVVKEKRRLERRVRKWQHQRALVPGRADSLTTWHWTHSDPTSTTTLPSKGKESTGFVPFHSPVLEWNDDAEFQKISASSSNWTQALTVRLIRLVERFDMRWPVVHDRWLAGDDSEGEPWTSSTFSLEELKERYFEVQCGLALVRDINTLPASEYAVRQDVRRKVQLRLLETSNVALSSTADLDRFSSLRRAQLKHRKEAQRIFKAASTLVNNTSDQTHGLGGKVRGGRSGRDGGGRLRPPPKSILDEKTGIVVSKHTVAVHAALSELGIHKVTTPTLKVNEKYNSLRDSLMVLFELQRLQCEAAYDVAVLRAQKSALRFNLKEAGGVAAGDDVPSAESGFPEDEQSRLSVGEGDVDALLFNIDDAGSQDEREDNEDEKNDEMDEDVENLDEDDADD